MGKEREGYQTFNLRKFEITNHLSNIIALISDKVNLYSSGRIVNNQLVCDSARATVVSASDYYPFGLPMPGRQFNEKNYRYGYNTQEKVDEIAGSGNHTTAMYWEYDTRLIRRWNLDPAGYPYQSHYSINNNNPILFTDPLGIYGTRREARQMRREAKAAGYDVGRVYKSDDGEFGFSAGKNAEWSHYFKKNYFGTMGANIQDPSSLGTSSLFGNPFKRIDGTGSAHDQLVTFFRGTSDQKKYFEPTSGYSYMMRNSPGVKNALEDYLTTGAPKYWYSFSPNKASLEKFLNSLPTSIIAHLDALGNANLARLSIGSYMAIITTTSDENIIRIHLENNMSMGSLLLHSKWAFENPPNTGPLSTVQMKIDLGLFDISSLRKK